MFKTHKFRQTFPLASILISAAVSLSAAETSTDEISRVTKYLNALEKNENTDQLLKNGLSDNNPNIRCAALFSSWKKHGETMLPTLKNMAKDPDSRVRMIVRQCAEQLKNSEDRIAVGEILKKQCNTEEGYFVTKLINGIDLSRKNLRLSENQEHDQAVNLLKRINLSETGWKFFEDRKENGLKFKFFSVSHDDSKWKDFHVKQGWSSQGVKTLGKGWYRLHFRMPEQIKDFNAVELHFPSVDTIAYVWLNGIYIGSHDEGRYGYQRPFNLDVTNEIKWDGENILTVLAQFSPASYSGGKGGILKPVSIEILK